jgi:acetyl esterase/lipase
MLRGKNNYSLIMEITKMKKQITRMMIVLLTVFAVSMFAQEKVIKLWPDGVPNSKVSETYKEEMDTTGSWPRISKVTEPRIDYYPAPVGKANGTAVVVCPGGGYGILAIGHEGVKIAEWLNSLGISAFVLKYRLPSDEIMNDKKVGPLQDVQQAIRIVRRNAKEWDINPNKIGVMGFSAGGHLASTASTHYNDKVYDVTDETSARPDFSLLIYPVISMDAAITHMGSRENLLGKNASQELVDKYSNELQVTKDTPPAFLVHSLDDNVVPVQNSFNYVLALKKNNVSGELHIYEKGGHGYGLGKTGGTKSSWPEACVKWLKVMRMM